MRLFERPKLYTSTAVENFINKYLEKGGEVITIKEGSLGWGTTLCRAKGFKTAIIQERFINHWSSGHTVRMYNKCPKKYLEH